MQLSNWLKKGVSALMELVMGFATLTFWLWLLMLAVVLYVVILLPALSLIGLMHLHRKLKADLAYSRMST